jgi:predicted transcriptional regulator
MARTGLGWSLDDLAEASGVARRTIARFEAGEPVKPETMETLRATFVKHGVEFVNGGRRVGVTVKRKDHPA